MRIRVFLLPLPRSTSAKSVHSVLKIGTFRFADYRIKEKSIKKINNLGVSKK